MRTIIAFPDVIYFWFLQLMGNTTIYSFDAHKTVALIFQQPRDKKSALSGNHCSTPCLKEPV